MWVRSAPVTVPQMMQARAGNRPRPALHVEPSAVHIVRSLDVTRWSAFVDGRPDASIFHTVEMHRAFAEADRYRPVVWAAVDGGGEIRALLTPVEISTLGRPFRSLTTRSVAFAGPLLASDEDRGEALETLLRAYQRVNNRSSTLTEVRNVADPTDAASSFAACGFEHQAHLNFLVDLSSPEEELWSRVAQSARRNIRKARREGVTIEEAAESSEIREGYEVLRDVYHRIRVPLPDRSLFAACHRILGPIGRFKVLLARRAGRTVGVLTLLLHNEVITYWYTGTVRGSASTQAGDLLVWHAIASGHAAGYRTLDFGGAGVPNQPYGVRDFKAKYGGRLVDFGREVWVPSALRLRIAKAGYEATRRFL